MRVFQGACLALAAILSAAPGRSNDGVYFMSGNQLVPVAETEIAIARERLTLLRDGDFLDVTVDYTFDNPGPARVLTLGFEAIRPDGDVETDPVAGGHPYMRAFSVTMNGAALDHQVALVAGEVYATDGQVRGHGAAEFGEWGPDLYVYHFQAPFVPGRNRILHRYRFDLSATVYSERQFDYVLTAANRWGGAGIGQFELEIDMGDMAEFQIAPTFFGGPSDWQILGQGRAFDAPDYYISYGGEFGSGAGFAIREGRLRFRAAGFRPAGELYLWVPNLASYRANSYDIEAPPFDAARHPLPFNLVVNLPEQAVDSFSARVLRNYPFARRGYVFRDARLGAYFASLPWYLPDPGYRPDLEALSETERALYRRMAD